MAFMRRRQPVFAAAVFVVIFGAVQGAADDPARWWMDEPMRLVQTNLRETDTSLDPARLVRQIAEFPANVLLFGMGGIVAHYPTKVPSHYVSPHLPSNRDTFGEVLKEAHARRIRVIGRFDLSKVAKPIYDAHPEWFFRKANGEPAVYNGLYATCVNGVYYREESMKILSEALDRYDVDGLFFNMFGQPSSDYSGNRLGLCHCDNCRSRFQAQYGRPLPDVPDAEYHKFIEAATQEITKRIADLIHSKRPRAGFFTYRDDYVDGIMSESNTAVDRPLPMWPYSASEHVERARTSQPTKMAVNLSIGFVDIPYRFSSVSTAEIQSRLYQNMAHGSGPTHVALGTLDQEDMTGVLAARLVFAFHAKHEDLYVGQENLARVLLYTGGQDNFRGVFRILTENHIPFAVSSNPDILTNRTHTFDLVIAAGETPPGLDAFVKDGGRALLVGTRESALLPGAPVRKWTNTRSSYFRIRDRSLFPSLKDTQLLFLDGDYLELPPVSKPLLTLIPPSMFGPPEKVHIDRVETDKPGLLLADHGKGRVAVVPWDVGRLYHRHGSQSHAGFVVDLVDHLLPQGRQIKTNAHPLIELTLMKQPKRNRTIVHLVNLSGHSSTAYFAPLKAREIEVQVEGKFRRARSIRLDRALTVSGDGHYSRFTLPELEAYDAVVLEQ